jgi:hypothetical protein
MLPGSVISMPLAKRHVLDAQTCVRFVRPRKSVEPHPVSRRPPVDLNPMTETLQSLRGAVKRECGTQATAR